MTYVSPSTGREIKAVLFDTFGSVVDWRSGVAREVAAFARAHRMDVDAEAFADAWRAKYEPSMEPIRNGNREFVPLDRLHLENLHATLPEFGLDAANFDDRELGNLNSAWERLDPWQDSIAGLGELRQHVIVGPLSNANLALLLRMALRAKLPWTVIVGSDATGAYKPTLAGVSEHGVDPSAGSRRGHARGGPQPRSCVCATGGTRHSIHPASK